ncbi:MAG TPA: flagellar export chaperone FlgN [Desulfuromonadaceae bacterium]|jgi:flagellar biosynthesis/type III secretory pathway chaperone
MHIKNLGQALSLQLQALKELLELLEQETDEMTALNIEAMAEINAKKEAASARIQEHTAPLRQLISEVAAGVGLSVECPLGELAASLAKQGHKEIVTLHEQLNRVAKQVREVAATNHDIAERFAATLNQSLNFLTKVLSESNAYGASGSYQQRPAGAVMINMEA